MDEAERDELQRLAREQGMSLSAWLRDAGRQRAEEMRQRRSLSTTADLDAFFSTCDDEEEGPEPDWEEHLLVIQRSRSQGTGDAT